MIYLTYAIDQRGATVSRVSRFRQLSFAVRPNATSLFTSMVMILLLVNTSIADSVDSAGDSSTVSSPLALHGIGSSHWGEITVRSDSNTALFTQQRKPSWEKAVLVPYYVAMSPLYVLRTGLRASIIYLDEHRIINRIMNLIGPRQGPFGMALAFQAGGLSGFGGGLTATHEAFLGPGNLLKIRWKSTVRDAHYVSMGVLFHRERPWSLMLVGGYKLRPNARYFGIGPQSADSLESFYAQEVSWGGFSIRKAVLPVVDIEGMLLFSGIGAREPINDSDTPISVHHTVVPTGYKERSDGITTAFSLIRDTTVENGRPETGGIQRIKASHFKELNSRKVPFWTFRGEIQQFVPLWLSKQILAVRAHMTWIETGNDEDLPFQRLLTNDDPDLLRGYRDFRWRGRGLTTCSLEYRWPLWANRHADDVGLGAYLFVDAGQVFDDFSEISTDNVTASYGTGIRLIGYDGFIGRLEIGWSDEEMVIRLRADQIFQFSKDGLIHGRDQVALR